MNTDGPKRAGRLLFFILLFEFHTGPVSGQSRIIDGVTADVRQYQFYALISYRQMPKPNMVPVHCGGALVHPLFVVSAFHCFKNVQNPQKTFVVHFLIQNRCKKPDNMPFDIAMIHQLPDSQLSKVVRNDIVVVELTMPVEVESYAKLPSHPLRASTLGIVVGFGLTRVIGKGKTNDLPCMLQKTNEFVLPLSRCGFSPDRIIGSFCAHNPLRGFATACRGDSGGPWLTRDASKIATLRGVSSFGDSLCNQDKTHDAYTNVYFYVGWMKTVIASRGRGIPLPYSRTDPTSPVGYTSVPNDFPIENKTVI